MIFIVLIVLLAAVDLCVKQAIEEQKVDAFPKELSGTNGKVILYKSHNPGFSFGFLKKYPHLVQMVPLAAVSFFGGILTCLLQKKGSILGKLALSFTIGGALSNLYDRMFRGYVVDYFSIQSGKLKKVIFNLGDIFIFLGTGLILIAEIIRTFRDR